MATRASGSKHTRSGFTVAVSDAEWTMRDQAPDGLRFLQIFADELVALTSRPDVEEVRLDFPVALRDVFAQAEVFPPDLVRAAGRAGIGLEITLYPCAEDAADELG